MTKLKGKDLWAALALGALVALSSCSTESSSEVDVKPVTVPASSKSYIVLAWNDLGMHCLNPTYDQAVILPPYNTVWAQVIKRGQPPQIATSGLTVKYSILRNTNSYGKRSYGQFWDNCSKLFGVSLAPNTGLNLEDPNLHNGLSGTMLLKGDHFQVNGIPVTPVEDSGIGTQFKSSKSSSAMPPAAPRSPGPRPPFPLPMRSIAASATEPTRSWTSSKSTMMNRAPIWSPTARSSARAAMAARLWARRARERPGSSFRMRSTASTLPVARSAMTAIRALPPNATGAPPTPPPTATVSPATAVSVRSGALSIPERGRPG